MKYLVLDLETGSKKQFGRFANPFTGDNSIVAIGLKPQGLSEITNYLDKNFNDNEFDDYLIASLVPYDIIVGHNIKFDLLYLWKYKGFQKWLRRGGKIWDTQLAEYMLSGQRHIYPSLRDIAVNSYGCPEREKLMEKYWENEGTFYLDKNENLLSCDEGEKLYNDWKSKEDDLLLDCYKDGVYYDEWGNNCSVIVKKGSIDTSYIPKELVLEDVRNDVLDTEQIMLQQVKIAKKEGMFTLIMEIMDGLLSTTEMEFNGIYLNEKIMNRNEDELDINISETIQKLSSLVEDKVPFKINFSSSDQLSILFFGGTVKQTVKIPMLNEIGVHEKYKSGKQKGELKYKNEVQEVKIKGMGLKPLDDWKKAKKGMFSTDEKVLNLLAKKAETEEICNLLLQLRALEKLKNTYYKGFREYIHPNGLIHGHINHVKTVTGRTSSDKPNLQNIPR